MDSDSAETSPPPISPAPAAGVDQAAAFFDRIFVRCVQVIAEENRKAAESAAALAAAAAAPASYHGTLAEIERAAILARLEKFGGSRALTAASLGMGVRTLGMKLKSWGMTKSKPERKGRSSTCTA